MTPAAVRMGTGVLTGKTLLLGGRMTPAAVRMGTVANGAWRGISGRMTPAAVRMGT